VRVELLPAQGTRHLDRRALAERLHNDIADALGIERNALAGAPGLAAAERPAPLAAQTGAGGTATV
jgi:hypothetical protein